MNAARNQLVNVLIDARRLLALPENEFCWSSWQHDKDALDEIDQLIKAIQSGARIPKDELSVLFAPTGPIQEVSISSGWSGEFLSLAGRFDAALALASLTG